MLPPSRVPLAWLNLTRDKRRLLVSLAGISFAVILMFVETGFYFALFDSTVLLIRHLNADLILTSSSKDALAVSEPFTRRRLEQARSFAGVAGAYPLYIERVASLWRNPDPEDHSVRPIRVLAVNLNDPVLDLPEVERYREQLKLPNTALMDVKSKAVYGECREGVSTELTRRTLNVVGTFSLGTDFTNDGTLIMSDVNFARYFSNSLTRQSPLAEVELGVIQLQEGADPVAVQTALNKALPDDVMVLTRDQYIDKEMRLWKQSSPIGFIFGLGTVIGFVVGVVICYQILSTDIADHLAEFATLKAIGYRNSYLTGVVLQEALFLSLLGFIPGIAVSATLYALLAHWTGLPLQMTLERTGFILILTVVMCIISGSIAVRKAQSADPAEVF